MQRRTFIKLSTVLPGLGTLIFSTIKAIPVNKFNKTREIKTKIPSSLKYTKEHIWIQINGSTAKIGVTDFLQSELGDIVYIELPTTDKTLVKDEVFASIEAVKTIHELHMPVSGEIIKTNPLLEDEPNMINQEPYKSAWIIQIKIINFSELDKLLSAQQYRKHIS